MVEKEEEEEMEEVVEVEKKETPSVKPGSLAETRCASWTCRAPWLTRWRRRGSA